jgi:hypothetical protein
MDEHSTRVAELLHEAAETHHQVFRITDGADDDWASWYAQWLVTLSELPELLGAKVVRSELTYLLVRLDKEYTDRARLSAGRTTTLASWSATSVQADA